MYVVDDTGEMALPASSIDCIKEMKQSKLVGSVEELMSLILELPSVTEAYFSFRNTMIDRVKKYTPLVLVRMAFIYAL